MLLAKKMNFVDDSGCVTNRDNEHKRNIHFITISHMYMYHWDVYCTTEIIVQFNVLFCVLFAEEDRTSENFMSILEKQVCQKYRKICILLGAQGKRDPYRTDFGL